MEIQDKKQFVFYLNICLLALSIIICMAIWKFKSSNQYYMSDGQVEIYRLEQRTFDQEIMHPYLVIDVQPDSLERHLHSNSISTEISRPFPYLFVNRHLVIYVSNRANNFVTTCRNEVIPIIERYKLQDDELKIADDGSVTIDLKEHDIDGGKYVTLPAVLLSALFEENNRSK